MHQVAAKTVKLLEAPSKSMLRPLKGKVDVIYQRSFTKPSVHLLHQLGVGGRRLVLVDLVLGPAVLILKLGRDEVVGIVHT